MNNQHAQLDWKDGRTPVSTRFDDPYYSLESGLDEARHVFLQGNDLPARASAGFRVAELGFGTGLNLLATFDALRDHPGPLFYTSFEAYPMSRDDMVRALRAFPSLDSAPLLDHWGAERFALGPFTVRLIFGDARETLPSWEGQADAWYLDGFSPAKNPELWTPELMAAVAAHTATRGTFATYTAAGHVRRALAAAGFEVSRIPGYGRKRHMSRGHLP